MRLLRVVARVVGTVGASIYALMLYGEYLRVGTPVTIDGYVLGSIGALLIVSEVVAWFEETVPGVMLIVLSLIFVAFMVITVGSNVLLAALFVPSPFMISGVLYIIDGNYKQYKMVHAH